MFHNGIWTTVTAPLCDALTHCRCKTTCWVSAGRALMWPDIDVTEQLRWLTVQQQRNLDQSSSWLIHRAHSSVSVNKLESYSKM